jgi:hypothetical protein
MENLDPTAVVRNANRPIFLSGALGALGLFFQDETCREVMIKISGGNFMDNVLATLEDLQQQKEDDSDNHKSRANGVIRLALIKFLCEWIQQAPAVVQALLSSTRSIVLGSLLKSSHKQTAALASLLVGMCMEYLPDDVNGESSGGWTRSSILQLLSGTGGISMFLSNLEDLKKKSSAEDLLWKASPLEYKTFCAWYSSQVMVVRRRVVQELSGGEKADDDTESLQKLVAQQAKELDGLRELLSKAESTSVSLQQQLELGNGG